MQSAPGDGGAIGVASRSAGAYMSRGANPTRTQGSGRSWSDRRDRCWHRRPERRRGPPPGRLRRGRLRAGVGADRRRRRHQHGAERDADPLSARSRRGARPGGRAARQHLPAALAGSALAPEGAAQPALRGTVRRAASDHPPRRPPVDHRRELPGRAHPPRSPAARPHQQGRPRRGLVRERCSHQGRRPGRGRRHTLDGAGRAAWRRSATLRRLRGVSRSGAGRAPRRPRAGDRLAVVGWPGGISSTTSSRAGAC